MVHEFVNVGATKNRAKPTPKHRKHPNKNSKKKRTKKKEEKAGGKKKRMDY